MKNRQISLGGSICLDSIRAASAQLVLVGHGVSYFSIFTFIQPPNFPSMQNIAVVVFFILSGFLIPYSVARNIVKEKYTLYRYIVDRFSRIYVAFIPAILIVILIDASSIILNEDIYRYHGAFNIKTFIGNILMLQDFPMIEFVTSFGSGRPFWTLAIEWWIYLLFGFFVSMFLLDSKLTVVGGAILMLLAIVPVYNFLGGRGGGLTLYWLFGTISFAVWNSRFLDLISKGKKVLLFVGFVAIAGIRVMWTMYEYDPIFAFALAIAILLLVDLCSHISILPILNRVSIFLASYSYTLYLIHYSILDFLASHFGDSVNPYALFVVGLLVSNLLAMLIGRYFEVHITKIIRLKMYSFARVRESATPMTDESR